MQDATNTKQNRVLSLDFTESVKAEENTEKKEQTKDKPKPKKTCSKATLEKRAKTTSERLTPMEQKFCKEYVKTGKAAKSVMSAGYNASNMNSAGVHASYLLSLNKIQKEIQRLQRPDEDEAIATATEVMRRLTAIARGEDTDQFGMEISADTKLKALVELARRTVDLENKVKAKENGDNAIVVKLDWGKKKE